MHTVLALNGGKDSQGNLHPDTIGRINAAMNFAAIYGIGRVIMVGGDADSMCEYASDKFSDTTEPVSESMSVDTIEGAHQIKLNFIQPDDELDVFTSDYHTSRTNWIFRRVIGKHYGIVHPVKTLYTPHERRIIDARESAQLLFAKVKLSGIGPEDDQAREARMAAFRFRGVDRPLQRFISRGDSVLNVRASKTKSSSSAKIA